MAADLGTPVFAGNTNEFDLSVPVNVTISAGQSILIGVTYGHGNTGVTVTCPGQTVALIVAQVDTTNSQDLALYTIENPGAGTYTITLACSTGGGGGGQAWMDLFAVPVLDCVLSSIDVGNSANLQAAPGTGTDAITSGTAITPSAYPVIAVGLSFNSDVAVTPSVGTSWTSVGTGFAFSFTAGLRVEKRYYTSGTAQATFTASTGTGRFSSLLVALREGGGPTITGNPSDAHVDVGATANFTLTATASGGGTLSYQWKDDGSNVGTNSNSYAKTGCVLSDDASAITCDITETGGSNDGTKIASATLRVGVILVGSGAIAYSAASGTSVAPAYPAGIQAGDKLALILGQKPSAANGGTATTPGSWTLDDSLTGANDGNTGGYTTTLGADTGNCNIYVFDEDATGSESGTLPVTVGTNNVCWAQMLLFRAPAGATWSVASTTGKDTAAGNLSIAGAADPGVTAGDYLLCASVQPTDVSTPSQFSAHAITQTGVTFDNVAELSEPDSTAGNDIGGLIFTARAASGTSSAAPTFTATAGGTTTNVRGPGVLLRLRATVAAAAPTTAPLNVQQRAKGFPPRGPLPGIARLGFGILAVTTQPTLPVDATGASAAAPFESSATGAVGSGATGSSAASPFGSSAVGTVTFTATGSSAASSFAPAGTGATAPLVTDAPWAQAQPMAQGFGRPSRLPAPPVPRLGSGILRVDVPAAVVLTGSGASAISAFASSAAGLVTFVATGSSAASPFASSAVAAQAFTGSASAAVSPVASSAAGAEAFTGAASSTASPIASTASGAQGFTASASSSCSPFASSAAGAESFAATGTSACSSFASSGAAEESFSGSSSSACSPFGSTGSAAVGSVFVATGSSALSPVASSAAGLEAFAGSGSATCAPFASSATGVEAFYGSATTACSPFGSSGNAAVGTVFSGSGSSAISPFASSATGSEVYTATGSAACSPFASSASGLETFTGTASSAASPCASSSAGTEEFSCSGSSAASPFGSVGNAAQGAVFTGTGSSAASPFDSTATVTETFPGSAISSVSPFASTSTGSLAFLGDGSSSANSIGSSGVGMVGDFIGVAASTLSPFGSLGVAVFTSGFVAASSPGRIIAGGTYNPRRRTV